MEDSRIVRFDWAAKRILRQKANFDVLEGLVTVLLNEPVHIVELLESESNQNDATDKFNRVDIKAKNSKDEIIIVEIQLTRQLYYLERILYGVSKAITEHIVLGEKYDQVKKIYSINILYFDLGKGSDYLYHGTTSFRGVHKGDLLEISTKEKDAICMRRPEDIFPEYFIIRVNEFNDVATTPLEEWLDYLKNDHIKEDTTAPGLQAARRKLQFLQMNKQEREAYERHLDNIMVQNDVLDTAKMEGRAEGRAEGLEKGLAEGRAEGLEKGLAEGLEKGRAEGLAEGRADIVKNMLVAGMDESVISQVTGLSVEEIHAMKRES